MIANRLFRFVRLVPIAGVAALLIPITASADTTSIQPTSASLVAKGAAVDVMISFTCPSGDKISDFGGMPVFVQQAVSKTELASGFSQFTIANLTCTGSPQTTIVDVLANLAGPPFRTGPALVSAYLNACNATWTCVNASAGPVTLRVTK